MTNTHFITDITGIMMLIPESMPNGLAILQWFGLNLIASVILLRQNAGISLQCTLRTKAHEYRKRLASLGSFVKLCAHFEPWRTPMQYTRAQALLDVITKRNVRTLVSASDADIMFVNRRVLRKIDK